MIQSLRVPEVTNNSYKIQLSRISHVYFEHADLSKFEAFAYDFGFEVAQRSNNTIYYRGYGRDPFIYVASQSSDGQSHFNGTAFVAASREDFNKAAQLSGASVRTLNEAPGGGEIITITRPNGTFFYIVYGQQEREIDMAQPLPSETHLSQGPYNTPFSKPRLGRFQRYQPGRALVHKLGHYGYVCKEFDSEISFYLSNFNFVPSDILHDPDHPEIDVLTFIHLDLGKDYSDHHSFFLARAPPEVEKTYLHHSSYEVADFDTQLMGHQYLAQKGWKSVWGVGRHILGSQIFDYWKDASDFNIEHYTDGDMVNVDVETKRDAAGPVSIWGPEVPKDFGVGVEEEAFS